MTVCPALLPPWLRTTMSAFPVRTSMILPLPSSPHCAPTNIVFAIALPVEKKSGWFDLNDGQGKAQPKLVAKINLDVMEAELLELHSAEIMDVSGVAFHFLQIKIDFRLRDRLGVIRADDFRALMKSARAAAPPCPDAEAQVIDRQFRRGHDVEHAD